MSKPTQAAAAVSAAVSVQRPADGVALVTLNRPDLLNAIDPALADGLSSAFADLAADEHVSVVILTGAGRGFCSGADLVALSAAIGADGTGLQSVDRVEFMRAVASPVVALDRLPQITIAAVNGPAIGAGWGLAMGCDIRIAGPAAQFGATFVRMGVGPDYGLSRTLPETLGWARAVELLATGRIIDGNEAQQLGLVSTVADDAVAAAIELAATMAAVPTRAIRSLKATLQRSATADMTTVVNDIEAQAQADLFGHPDFVTDAMGWLTRHGGTSASTPTHESAGATR